MSHDENNKTVVDELELDQEYEIVDISYEVTSENRDKGYGMEIGDNIRLSLYEMEQLKKLIDQDINSPPLVAEAPPHFNVKADDIKGLLISKDNPRLKYIPVSVENIEGRILVKVGPCDLSGVGGHKIRECIIKDLVNQALTTNGYDKTFAQVNVSACVGVRGRLQMVTGFFKNNREHNGNHMNAYIKTASETHLTHWEPRKGPQRWYNDTICAMVTSTTTSIFEQKVRAGILTDSHQATKEILKNPNLVTIFDNLIAKTHERIIELVKNIKTMLSDSNNNKPS